MLHTAQFESPIGTLEICASEKGIRWINLPECGPRLGREKQSVGDRNPILCQAAEELSEYFKGIRRCFNVLLDARGTEFQLQVWMSLKEIPYGSTKSYAEQASIIGRPKAARAVGGANAMNPIPIILPCHRVIGSNGALTGYGGGTAQLHLKEYLLSLEKGNA